MNSIDTKCNELKWSYDSCLNIWLPKFIGQKESYPPGFVPCEQYLKPYQECVEAALQKRNINLTETVAEVQEACVEDLKRAEMELKVKAANPAPPPTPHDAK